MPDPRIEDLERAAARHWQAPGIPASRADVRLAPEPDAGFRDSHRYHYMLTP